jgi:hypothetical protein
MPPERRRSLLEAQREFARELVAAPGAAHAAPADDVWAARPPIATGDRLAVYRNNAWQFFRAALELTYPVVRRRVGEDFFRQLAREYRDAHPSHSGDLHWVGEAFPAWLSGRLGPTEYAWLADLARLEWACESALTSGWQAPLPLAALAQLPSAGLDDTTVALQPSLRLVASPWPVWSVWQANQGDDAGAAVDLTVGGEHCACVCQAEGIVVYRVDPDDYAVLAALAGGGSFTEALEETGRSANVLARALGWAFGEGLVVALNPSAPA